ncbi:Carbohydrate-binding protein [Gryllus bimaculatus]|nr:Carbohydrate-binding protein [Gryllus bimaculatus]
MSDIFMVSSNQDLVEKFSCEGRAAGFYADIPSGCQMYHNCDEAGRVFTHTCPERTLFQQRTMVCDHWYMVECSGASPPPAAPPRPRPSARRSPPLQVQAAPAGGADPARKRHSQRVVATFPYQRGNESTNQNSNVRSSNSQDRLKSFKISSNSQEKLESFKISSSPQEKLESFKISSSPQEKLESFKISSSPQEKLESFKISSLPSTTPRSFDPVTPSTIVSSPPHVAFSSTPPNVFSSTPRTVIASSPRPFVSSAARIERVERPIGTFVPIIPFHNVEQNREREFRNLNRPVPTVGRAKIERVFKESVLSSPGAAVISQVQYISPFREPKAEFQFPSTTPRTTSQATPSFIENKYNNNPYFESYFRTSYAFESTTTSKPVQTTTTRSYVRQEEEDISENKVELVIPDPRKMFYIPESNYDPGESAKEGGTVLVIELPGKNSMKFQRVGVTEARNHDCPQCHPSFLLPGLCRPCVLIR